MPWVYMISKSFEQIDGTAIKGLKLRKKEWLQSVPNFGYGILKALNHRHPWSLPNQQLFDEE